MLNADSNAKHDQSLKNEYFFAKETSSGFV